MKTMKKILALALVALMVFSMGMTVMAEGTEETYTISRHRDDTHSYSIYQIFTGDLSGDVLSNIKWGVNGTGTVGEDVYDEVIAAITAVKNSTDTERLAVIDDYVVLTGTAYKTIDDTTTSVTVPAGYYLIKDTSTISGNNAATLYIVEVVGKIIIERKEAIPTLTKVIVENGLKVNEAAINELVNFEINATLPDRYEDYAEYYVSINDTFELRDEYPVFDLVANSITVTVDGTEITEECAITTSDKGFNVVIADLKTVAPNAKAADTISVTYSAKLNDKAEIGGDGNQNSAVMDFSNDPNDSSSTGTTPEDKTVTYTTSLTINKVDENNVKLSGATFKIVGEGIERTVSVGDNGVAIFEGLAAGTYTVTETETPDGYNTISPITIKITFNNLDTNSGEYTFEVSNEDDIISDSNNILSIKVVNQAGTTLPTTGGIGTTVIYVAGAVLLIGALVLLITRRRMKVED